MTVLSDAIDRMMAAGMTAGEAGQIAAEVYAAGVAAASVRSPGAERTRRWRHKASQNVTERHTNETSPNVTERHKASQCDVPTVSYRDTNSKKVSRQNSERASRGTRIESEWRPSEADRLLAKQEGLSESEVDREALRFRDYWKGRAGSGGVKLDWSATWRNWVRTSAEKLGKAPTSAQPVTISGFYATTDSEQLEAWDQHNLAQHGKRMPRDRNGGWRVSAEWPPGYEREDRMETPVIPMLRSMQ